MEILPLILASSSPRRLQILQSIGYDPKQIIAPDIDETPLKRELPKALSLRLAQEKCLTVEKKIDDKVIILAADTVVAVGRRILDKPKDAGEAAKHLQLLSGRRHRVYSALAAKRTREEKTIIRLSITMVQFKRLSQEEITHYIQSGEWQGKAGGYAIHEQAGRFIKQISGSYTGVMGLDAAQAYQVMNSLA